MKIPHLLLIICSTTFQGFSQEIKIEKHDDVYRTRLLNIIKLVDAKETSELMTKIYFMSNPSGSAVYPTSEVTHNVIVAVSEFDEFPLQNSFEISEFYDPELASFDVVDERIFRFSITYGPYDDRKKKTFEFSLDYLKEIAGS